MVPVHRASGDVGIARMARSYESGPPLPLL